MRCRVGELVASPSMKWAFGDTAGGVAGDTDGDRWEIDLSRQPCLAK